MKKYFPILYILPALFLLIFYGISFAQDADIQKSNWLLGVIFKLENIRDKTIEDIQKYEGEIQKCDNTISKAENIVSLAQQKGNVKAEEIAREASLRAQEAKTKNIELKISAERNKKKVEDALAYVKNVFSEARLHPQAHPHEIQSVITNYSGHVSIQKDSGENIDFGKNQIGLLEKGNEIVTYGNSRAELQLLEGRGSMKVGEFSRVKMEEDGKGTQIINLMQGKVYISVEKLESYQKMIEEKIKTYKEDLKTVKDEVKQKIVDEYKSFEKWRYKFAQKFELRTPYFSGAVRGTEFLVIEDDKTGTELIVLEGSFEMRGTKGEKTIIVNAGYKGTATKDGILSDPEKIDRSNLERWWEK